MDQSFLDANQVSLLLKRSPYTKITLCAHSIQKKKELAMQDWRLNHMLASLRPSFSGIAVSYDPF